MSTPTAMETTTQKKKHPENHVRFIWVGSIQFSLSLAFRFSSTISFVLCGRSVHGTGVLRNPFATAETACW